MIKPRREKVLADFAKSVSAEAGFTVVMSDDTVIWQLIGQKSQPENEGQPSDLPAINYMMLVRAASLLFRQYKVSLERPSFANGMTARQLVDLVREHL